MFIDAITYTVPNLSLMKYKCHIFIKSSHVFQNSPKKFTVKHGILKKMAAVLGYNLHTTQFTHLKDGSPSLWCPHLSTSESLCSGLIGLCWDQFAPLQLDSPHILPGERESIHQTMETFPRSLSLFPVPRGLPMPPARTQRLCFSFPVGHHLDYICSLPSDPA